MVLNAGGTLCGRARRAEELDGHGTLPDEIPVIGAVPAVSAGKKSFSVFSAVLRLSHQKIATVENDALLPCPCLILGLSRRVQYGFPSVGQAAHPNFVEGQGVTTISTKAFQLAFPVFSAVGHRSGAKLLPSRRRIVLCRQPRVEGLPFL